MASGIALSLFERFDNLLTFMLKDLTHSHKPSNANMQSTKCLTFNHKKEGGQSK